MALATALKALLLLLGCGVSSLFIYILRTNPLLDFCHELTRSPWMVATTVDVYLFLIPIALWISYKESNWILSALRIIPLLIIGSPVACGYIVIQLVELSAQESKKDPIFYVLLSKNKDERRSNSMLSVVNARLLFITFGSLIAGTLVYAAITDGSPFRSGILTPWFTATLVDDIVNAIIVSVWIAYKEQSWISAALWIVLLMGFGSVVLSAYVVVQLFHLSPKDPAFLVLFNNRARNGDEGSLEALI